MSKSNRIETEKRVEAVRIALLQGQDSTRIVQNIAAATGVKERQAWNYIKAARARIEADVEPLKMAALGEHIAVRRLIRSEAIKAGDLRTALESAKDEAKLFDLYPAAKSEVTGRDGKDLDMGPAVIILDK